MVHRPTLTVEHLLSEVSLVSSITFCHANDSSVGAHHQHAEVRSMACHSKDGGLEVLLVAGQINEGDDFCRGSADVHPVQTA